MNFDRWLSPWSRTWEYRIFKSHHTELNDMWWAHSVGSKGAAKTASSYGPSAPTHHAFSAAKHTIGRGTLPLSEWYNHYKTFDNWVHLSCAVSLCSYFEIYLCRTVALALRSDPGVLLSSSRAVDGVRLLKRNALPEISQQVGAIVKGTWPQRIAAYQRVFGVVPVEFSSQATELDNLRRLRNSVGHAFGRFSDENLKFSPFELASSKQKRLSGTAITEAYRPSSFQHLSDQRLKTWLGVVENSVNAIEEHLRTQHIGSYEILEAYHFWDKSHNIGHQSPHGALKALFGHGPGAWYFKQAINFYRKA